jgi:hypothetical protein
MNGCAAKGVMTSFWVLLVAMSWKAATVTI